MDADQGGQWNALNGPDVTLAAFYPLVTISEAPLVIKKNSVVRVRERTMLTERPPLVGEVSTNVCW
jgi:hypothetical protein